MKISFIGAGNIAWHLAPALERAGHSIKEVYSRHLKNAEKLCKNLYDAEAQAHVNFSRSKAQLFIIAVTDGSLPEVLEHLILPPQAIVVHTSGSHGVGVFDAKKYPLAGVFYLLQTFSRAKPIQMEEVPICIEGSNQEVESILLKLAASISKNVQLVSSQNRKTLHIAAVFACNFTNHLYSIAAEILKDKNLSLDLLKPLMQETLEKALELPPKEAQTGPAYRGDANIIQEHLAYLEKFPTYQQIYRLLTESIIKVKNADDGS